MARNLIAQWALARSGMKALARWAGFAGLAALMASCGGEDLSPRPNSEAEAGGILTGGRNDPNAPTVFGDGGISIGTINRHTNLFGLGSDPENRLPVNKYLWQAALDTLSFLPMDSTDPFTGVIATEWSSTEETPNDRFKVTAFITSPALSAASLKVAVYREVLTENGVWVAAPVDAATPRKLEDAILTRAREIRIAEREGRASG